MTAAITLDVSLLRSTVWQLPQHCRCVWLTLLLLADADGVIEASVPGLALWAGVTVEQCEHALDLLRAPDHYSRTREADGRRIENVAGGWRLINYHARLARESARARQLRYQARQRAKRAEAAAGEPPPTTSTQPVEPLDTPAPPPTMPRRASPPVDAVVRHERPRAVDIVIASRTVPAEWRPNEAHAARAAELGLDLPSEAERFRLYEFDRPYSDWDRRFGLWLVNSRQRAEATRAKGRNGAAPTDGGVTGFERVRGAS